MNRTVLLIGVMSGCFESEPPGYVASDALQAPPPTPVTVHWRFETAAGIPQPCPDGYDLVRVLVRYLRSARESSTGAACADGKADVIVAPSEARDTGQIFVTVQNAAGELYGTAGGLWVMVGGTHVDVPVTIITDRGLLHVSWILTRGAMPLTCAEAGIDRMQIAATTIDGATSNFDADCARGFAGAGPLPSGPAQVAFFAGGITRTIDVVVPTGGRTVEVPTLTIEVP